LIEGTEHDLTITGANFKNVLDQVPRQGGICSPCHVVHTAQYEKYLWAGPLGQPKLTQWKEPYRSDKNFMVMLCTGCHSEGNVAKNQIPQFGLHPRGLTFPVEKSGPLNQPFPIYNDLGELSPDGNIVCSTCHNPHQWNSQHNIKGPGIHVEGNATNSFLREEVRETFCTVCHGEDSLFKFKYFHSPIGRGKEQPFSLFKQKEVKKR
jgi:hypothetical protein